MRSQGIWLVFGFAVHGAAWAQSPVLLTEAQATCIARHAGAYIAQGKPIYVIVLPPDDVCPETLAAVEALADQSTASGGAGIGMPKGDSSGFVVLTAAQLRCLQGRLDRVIDRTAPQGGKVRLALERCGP